MKKGEYVYAIATSPRPNANTTTLLEAVLEGCCDSGLKIVFHDIRKMDVNPCRACNHCFKNGNCIQDDEVQEMYPHMLNAGAVLLAAPVMSMGMAAQAKAVVDRCQRFWSTANVLKREVVDSGFRDARAGLYISCCGAKSKKPFESAIPTVKYFFEIIGIDKYDNVLMSGVDEPGEIKLNEKALKDCYERGVKLSIGLKGQHC